MSQPQQLCVYCGNPGVTKEHIWGKWSRKLAPNAPANNEHVIVRPRLGDKNATMTKGAMNRPGNPRSQTLKIACRWCNGGWMKKIVDDAIPILTELSQDIWLELSDDSRRRLAAWIVLFTMSHEYADRETVCVSASDRDNFRKSGVPSSHWRIAIGRIEPVPDVDSGIHRAIELAPDVVWSGHRRSQVTAFVFGKLLAVSYYSECPFSFSFEAHAREMKLRTLWPHNDKFVVGPPELHADKNLETIVHNLTVALEDASTTFGEE